MNRSGISYIRRWLFNRNRISRIFYNG